MRNIIKKHIIWEDDKQLNVTREKGGAETLDDGARWKTRQKMMSVVEKGIQIVQGNEYGNKMLEPVPLCLSIMVIN